MKGFTGMATGLLLAAASVNAAAVSKKTTTTSTTSVKTTSTSSVKTTSTSSVKTTSTSSVKTTSTSSVKTSTTTSSSAKATASNKITSLGELTSASTVSSILDTIISTVISTVKAGTALNFVSENPFTIEKVAVSSERYTHDLTWPSGPTTNNGQYVNWTTYDGNGVNIGCWLELEYSCYEDWWASLGTTATDEWDLCEQLGDDCPTVMKAHYASFINTTSIDKVAAVGVNTLRIPTTYAAWVDVPGSQFYHGDQTTYLQTITDYAIETYGMHIVVGLHSLPGGVNTLDIGEAYGHDAWFQNSTNLAYSLQAIDAMLTWINGTGHANSFTIEPINEAADDFDEFGTCAGLTTAGAEYVAAYITEVLQIVETFDGGKIPVMFQDCFCGESFWSPYFNTTQNLVFDTHVYYFSDAGVYSEYVDPAVCGQASTLSGDDEFPVFVGEWSLQVTYNNTYANRQTIFDTQRYAWSEYVHGGSMWNIVHYGNATVSGEGEQEDYWSYIGLIDAGVITSKTNSSYC